MTIEELNNKYGDQASELTLDGDGRPVLHPVYEKHLPLCWEIQSIYGHVMNENMSLGKARQLTAFAIENHLKTISNDI